MEPPPLPLTEAMKGKTNEFNILISGFYLGFGEKRATRSLCGELVDHDVVVVFAGAKNGRWERRLVRRIREVLGL